MARAMCSSGGEDTPCLVGKEQGWLRMQKINTDYKPRTLRCLNHDVVTIRPFMVYDDIILVQFVLGVPEFNSSVLNAL